VGEYDVVAGTHGELWSSQRLTIAGWYPHVSPLGADRVAAVVESYGEAPAIASLGGGEARVLRSFAPPGGAAVPGRMEPLSWRGRDGLEISGWLILPEGEARGLPLLVDVHGGPIAAHRNRYAAALRAAPVLAASGWAVLLPNPRGSGGRGQDFARHVVGDMGGEDAHDILRGIDQLVADGIADPARIAIFGTSYGGFMSAMMVAFHRRFAAAVAMSPVVNWYSQHFASQIPWFDTAFLGGSLAAPGGPYFERSAVFHLEGATTPTLVIGGARDKNTPTSQAVELYNGLVEAGAPAELVVYPEDGHSMRGYPAYVDSAARIVDWLRRHVAEA
jgi:dipeptidyl aminopeptidase/acylaminoacyl peptidase